MEKIPLGTRTCCRPQARGLTYLHVGSEKHLVGLMNLEFIFRQLLLLEHSPHAICGAELIAMARQFNHIPDRPTDEAEYAAALRQAYAEFCALQMPPGRDVAEAYSE
ncbi:MAG: hypothetical protein ACOCXI_16715 [Chloroflexota bacterium]